MNKVALGERQHNARITAIPKLQGNMAKNGDGDGSKCLEDTNSAFRELLIHPSSYTPNFNGDDNADELHDEVAEALLGSFTNKLSKKRGHETTKSSK